MIAMPYADHQKYLEYQRQYSREHPVQLPAELNMLYNARERSRKLGIDCTITIDDIQIPELCPVLGIPLVSRAGNRGPSPDSPTLDRIDLNQGYVPGNVQVISHRANRMKTDAGPEELLAFADWVYRRYAFGGR